MYSKKDSKFLFEYMEWHLLYAAFQNLPAAQEMLPSHVKPLHWCKHKCVSSCSGWNTSSTDTPLLLLPSCPLLLLKIQFHLQEQARQKGC